MPIDESFQLEIDSMSRNLIDLETEAITLDAQDETGEHAQALATALARRLASMLVTAPTPVRLAGAARPRPANVPRFARPDVPHVDDTAQVIEQLTSVIGTNSGHGYVWKRPDGLLARCGGPALCSECKVDAVLVGQRKAQGGGQ